MEIENIVANTVLLKAREGKPRKKKEMLFFLTHLNDTVMDEPGLSVGSPP